MLNALLSLLALSALFSLYQLLTLILFRWLSPSLSCRCRRSFANHMNGNQVSNNNSCYQVPHYSKIYHFFFFFVSFFFLLIPFSVCSAYLISLSVQIFFYFFFHWLHLVASFCLRPVFLHS